MNRLLFCIAFVWLSGFSFAQDQKHFVRGFVFDDEKHEPVPFQCVELIPLEAGKPALEIETSEYGFFSIPDVGNGTYRVHIEHPDFKTCECELIVTANSGAIIDLSFDLHAPGTETNCGAKKTPIRLSKADIERLPKIQPVIIE